MKPRSASLMPTALLVAAGALCAQPCWAQPLPPGTDDCLDSLSAREAGGDADIVAEVAEICPAYFDVLLESPWGYVLADVDEPLTRAGLGSLAELAADYEAPAATSLEADGLDALVAELRPFVPEDEPSMFDRIIEAIGDWIRGWFESDSDEQSWFAEWLSSISIPESLSRGLIYALGGLALVIIVAIVVNELRLSGLLAGGRRTQRRAATTIAGIDVPEDLSLDMIRKTADVGRKVELMLVLVVDRLRLRRRYRDLLRPDQTHRELVDAVGGIDDSARESFTELADAAERVTYANWKPDEASLERVLETGQSLVDRPGDERETRQ